MSERDEQTPPAPEKTPGDAPPETPREGQTTSRPGRPPLQTLVFWLIILFAFPLTLVVLNKRGTEPVQELDASDFEQLLMAERVVDAVIVKDPASGIRTITGKYRPPRTALAEGVEPEPVAYRVEVVYSDALDEMLRAKCPKRKVKPVNNFWSNILISLLPILVLVAVIYFMFSRQLKAAGRGAMQFGKSRARLTNSNQQRVTFEDVSGIAEAKEEVTEIIDYLRDSQKFQKLGGRIPKGVLMIGPPGTGKTLLARAIAGEADVPFFSISGSDFVEMFVGVGASRVRDMFEEGKRHAPCILFIDEIDAVGRSRFSGIGGGHDEREQTLNALLVEMDGFEPNAGIIVVAATNRPDVLDPALLRPGRFDRQITIDLPDVKGRVGILQVHARKVVLSPEVDLEVIARGTPGFSGADLSNLVNEAALLAAHLNKAAIEMDDLEEARDKVRWGKERRSRVIDEKDRRVTAFHEAGHTLVGLKCEHAQPLHKVTIVPRGNAYLGATMSLPERDKYTQGRAELLDGLAVLMGGRLAEELIFGDITSGAAMDIRQATELAKKMVCQWGMSERMGAVNYSGREEQLFLGRDITRSQDHSELTSREIDEEIRRIIDETEDRARKLLLENLTELKLLGNTLLERETMNARDIHELLGMPIEDNAAKPAQEAVAESDDTTAPAEEPSAEDVAETTQDASGDATQADSESKPEEQA